MSMDSLRIEVAPREDNRCIQSRNPNHHSFERDAHPTNIEMIVVHHPVESTRSHHTRSERTVNCQGHADAKLLQKRTMLARAPSASPTVPITRRNKAIAWRSCVRAQIGVYLLRSQSRKQGNGVVKYSPTAKKRMAPPQGAQFLRQSLQYRISRQKM